MTAYRDIFKGLILAGDLKGGTLSYVQPRDNVTFAELARHLSALGVDPEGDQSLTLGDQEGLVLWANLSESFCRAVTELRAFRNNVAASDLDAARGLLLELGKPKEILSC